LNRGGLPVNRAARRDSSEIFKSFLAAPPRPRMKIEKNLCFQGKYQLLIPNLRLPRRKNLRYIFTP
jgi:hypothetical protein